MSDAVTSATGHRDTDDYLVHLAKERDVSPNTVKA